jgi:uncharacterized protein involved in exopolysaccharide biosynthesis
MEQDEIYLIDMWRIFVREWRWFVGGLIVTWPAPMPLRMW